MTLDAPQNRNILMINIVKSALLATILASTAAQATIINVTSDLGGNEAADAETEFLSSLIESTTETFDNINNDDRVEGVSSQKDFEAHSASYSTLVGDFNLVQAGQDTGADTYIDDLMIESRLTGEFGRNDSGSSDTDFWLDSNDAEVVTWDIFLAGDAAFNALGFYLADAEDQGAQLQLTLENGSVEHLQIPTTQNNGNLVYISIFFEDNVAAASITFNNLACQGCDSYNSADGWGIDDVTVGKVPEPGTLVLLGLGLIGLGASRKRT